MKATFEKHTLQFKFDAGTSRGVLKSRDTYFVRIIDTINPNIVGVGEASPLSGLSVDDRPDFEEKLMHICQEISGIELQKDITWLLNLADEFVPENLPSIKFAFEAALLDWYYGGKRLVYDNAFSRGEQSILINGLIWMGDKDFMLKQIEDKLAQGFSCIKLKIGAIDFEQECALLDFIRSRFSKEQITLRVDANGAFKYAEALDKLNRLATYDLHSIEQPIRAGQEELMAKLCSVTPLPIALDEELIGKFSNYEKQTLLETIQPQYIVLKPTLLGGLEATKSWIDLAEKMQIGWWITSALESNIGLNVISQFAAQFDNLLPQGLGTGGLYHNNIEMPLEVVGERLWLRL